MTKEKFYGVRNSIDLSKSGVYEIAKTNYNQEIRGQGVESRRFANREQAQHFVDLFLKTQKTFFENGEVSDQKVAHFNQTINQKRQNIATDEAIAFTSGSYRDGQAGYGLVILAKNTEGRIAQKINSDAKHTTSVFAEISSVEEAIEWAKKHNKKKLTICFGCRDLADWALGYNRPFNLIISNFKVFCLISQLEIQLDWLRIPTYNGVFYSEQADDLARGAIAA